MGEFFEKKYNKTTLIYGLLTGFLVGLFLTKYGHQPSPILLVLSLSGIPLLFKRNPVSLVLLVMIGLYIGLWRGQDYSNQISQYSLLYDEEVTLIGKVIDDPAYNNRKQTEFHLGNIFIQESNNLPGRIKVSVFGGSDIKRGDIIEVKGKLREGFGNRQGKIGFANFKSIGRSSSLIETIRQKYFASVNSNLPEPQSSLGLGFLVGLRTILPDDLLDQLSTTGLTHIVAVSGYNLTILVRYTRKYLHKFSKFIATASSAGLIFGFLAVTGVSPSIFRASIVSGLALLAWYNGRDIKPMMLILLGAAITAYIQPTYMWLDIGWWLSFLAFFGVLILAPLITDRICGEKEPKFLMRTVIETTSAQIFALPLIMLIFGELSLISILANVLILPLIPLAMLLTFVTGVVGMLSTSLAGWVAWPAKILLTYMTELISILSKAPYALAELNIEQSGFIVIMLGILILTMALSRKSKVTLSGTRLVK